jgi:hypothetical protein
VVRDGKGQTTSSVSTQPIIDRLFDNAKTCVINPFVLLFPCKVIYDPEYGYPARFEQVDWDLGDVTEVTDLVIES